MMLVEMLICAVRFGLQQICSCRGQANFNYRVRSFWNVKLTVLCKRLHDLRFMQVVDWQQRSAPGSCDSIGSRFEFGKSSDVIALIRQ